MRLIIRMSGRILTREPTAASLGLNHIEVFSKGNDKSIKQKALYGNDGTLECFDWENFLEVGILHQLKSHIEHLVIKYFL